MSANSGYGICGAFNVYSSSAKLGNWVEDEAGMALAANARPAVGTYLPPTKVPVVYLVVLAILTYLFGIRAPLVAIVCWYIYHHQQTNS